MATTGNDQTVNRLYAEHSAALRAYVTRLLHDSHLAEDVVQDQCAVLVQLYAGETAPTAADSLGVPSAPVKSRLHHALTHLRRTFASA